MHGETDILRHRLWTAVWRRRAPLWLAALAPLVIAAFVLPQARILALAAMVPWAVWVAVDVFRWHARTGRLWISWLDAAVPALEDSSTLLASEATTPIARLQQQRLQARLAAALTADDYRGIARDRVRFGVIPVLASLVAAGAAWGYQDATVAPAAPVVAARVDKPIVDGEVYLRIAPPAYTGVAAFETAARDVQVPQYSQVHWCVRKPAGVQPVVELGDGAVLPVTDACAVKRVEDSLFWTARAAG